MTPRLDCLPTAQQRLWTMLTPCAEMGYILYGGTALALRPGHRVSVDFDFFTDQAVDRAKLLQHLPWLAQAQVLQDRPNTLTVWAIPGPGNEGIKVSFFSGIEFGRVGDPSRTTDGVAWVASLEDLLATKLNVMLQRIAAKDYLDIAAVLMTGIPLAFGLAAARALWDSTFQPMESLKALTYFEGGDLNQLPETVRQ